MGKFYKFLIVVFVTQSLMIVLISPSAIMGEIASDSLQSDNLHTISDDDPIVITSDADFINQGWPGNGSVSTPFVIEALTINSNQTCISISDTLSYFVVRNCILTNLEANTKVIELTNVRNGVIVSNNITFNLIGIDLHNCGSSVIEDNTLQHPETSYQDGIHAIRLYGSDYVEISRNFIASRSITGSTSYNRGILLNLSTDCTIEGNNISSFIGRGVYLENSGYCNVMNNSVDDCLSGYYLRASNDCNVEHNIATRTSMGFGVWVGINHNLTGNRAEENFGEGYVIANSYNCQLIGNVVKDIYSDNGIELIFGAADNMLYGNFILCDTVLDDGLNNDWDNGVDLGNYWSSYDGIGTYPIPGTAGSVDRFPQQYITPAINLVSIRDFEYGLESRVLNWTYSGQAPISYTLERLNESQMYQIESEGLWNESQTTLSLYLEPIEVGEYIYRFTALYEDGSSLTDETIVYIVPASGPHIGYVLTDSEYLTPDVDIVVEASVNDISGVSEVTLSYSTSIDVRWRNITMSWFQADLWTAMVPGQPNNTILYLEVFAIDTLGNIAGAGLIEKLVTDSPPISSPAPPRPPDEEYNWFTMVLMGGIIVEISFIVYVLRNRRYTELTQGISIESAFKVSG